MSNQFNRQVVIQAGKADEAGYQIRNLRCVFNIKKTSKTSFNTAKVQIYNMAADSRNWFNNFDIEDKANLLIVKAGYEENVRTVFVGNINLVSTSIERPNVVTTIEANDGEKAVNQLRVPFGGFTGTYAAGASAKRVLQDLIRASGLDQKAIDWSTVPDRQYVNGFCFQGMGKVLLDNLCSYLGLEWSIQNNHIKFVLIDESDYSEIVYLTPETGLIGSPTRLNDISSQVGIKKGSKANKEMTALGVKKRKKLSGGWEVKCLLQPTAEPGGVVRVKSAEVEDKDFRIIEVEHNGDTHGSDWTSRLTTKEM